MEFYFPSSFNKNIHCFRVYLTNTLFLKLVIQKVKYFTLKWRVITTGTLQKWPQEKPEIVSSHFKNITLWYCYSITGTLGIKVIQLWHSLIVNNNLYCSCCRGFTESIPRCFWDQQGENAAHTPNKAGSGVKFLRLLLWDIKFTRQGVSARQTGHYLCQLRIGSVLAGTRGQYRLGILMCSLVPSRGGGLAEGLPGGVRHC